MKLSTAGSLNFRGRLIRLREQASIIGEFWNKTRIKISGDILAADFKCSFLFDTDEHR